MQATHLSRQLSPPTTQNLTTHRNPNPFSGQQRQFMISSLSSRSSHDFFNAKNNYDTLRQAFGNYLKRPDTQANRLGSPTAPLAPLITSWSSPKQSRPLDNRASPQCIEDLPGEAPMDLKHGLGQQCNRATEPKETLSNFAPQAHAHATRITQYECPATQTPLEEKIIDTINNCINSRNEEAIFILRHNEEIKHHVNSISPEDYNIIDKPMPSIIDENLLPQPGTFSLYDQIPKKFQEGNKLYNNSEQLGYSTLIYLQTGPFYIPNSQPEEIFNEINQKTYVPIIALLDTGASISVTDYRLVKLLGLQTYETSEIKFSTLTSQEGTPMKVTNLAIEALTWYGESYPVDSYTVPVIGEEDGISISLEKKICEQLNISYEKYTEFFTKKPEGRIGIIISARESSLLSNRLSYRVLNLKAPELSPNLTLNNSVLLPLRKFMLSGHLGFNYKLWNRVQSPFYVEHTATRIGQNRHNTNNEIKINPMMYLSLPMWDMISQHPEYIKDIVQYLEEGPTCSIDFHRNRSTQNKIYFSQFEEQLENPYEKLNMNFMFTASTEPSNIQDLFLNDNETPELLTNTVYLTQNECNTLETWLSNEATQKFDLSLCPLHKAITLRCLDCRRSRNITTYRDLEIIQEYFQKYSLELTADDTYRIIFDISWKKDPMILFPPNQSNFPQVKAATKQLRTSLTKKGLLTEYHTILANKFETDLIQLTPTEISNLSKLPHFFIRHFPVVNPTNTSTPIRVVYDSSISVTKGHIPSKECLAPTKFLNDMLTISLSFRHGNYAFTADLSRAYESIHLNYKNQLLGLILWYKDLTNDEITIFRKKSMSFGYPYSYLVLEVTKILLSQWTDNPDVRKLLAENAYSDNLQQSMEDSKSMSDLYRDLTVLLSKYNFRLKYFVSNDPSLTPLEDIKPFLTDQNTIKSLGQQWNPILDTIMHQVDIKFETRKWRTAIYQSINPNDLTTYPITRRLLTSMLAQLYDPTNIFLSILIARCKLILHRACNQTDKNELDRVITDNQIVKESRQLLKIVLHRLNEILPFPRKVITNILKRVVVAHDASDNMLALMIYYISGPPTDVPVELWDDSEFTDANIQFVKNKLTNSTVPVNESRSQSVSTCCLLKLKESLSDYEDQPLQITLVGDNMAISHTLDLENTNVKNVAIRNSATITVYGLVELNQILKQSLITCSWLPGSLNIADICTKNTTKDPIQLLNSIEYRKGPFELRTNQLHEHWYLKIQNQTIAHRQLQTKEPMEKYDNFQREYRQDIILSNEEFFENFLSLANENMPLSFITKAYNHCNRPDKVKELYRRAKVENKIFTEADMINTNINKVATLQLGNANIQIDTKTHLPVSLSYNEVMELGNMSKGITAQSYQQRLAFSLYSDWGETTVTTLQGTKMFKIDSNFKIVPQKISSIANDIQEKEKDIVMNISYVTPDMKWDPEKRESIITGIVDKETYQRISTRYSSLHKMCITLTHSLVFISKIYSRLFDKNPDKDYTDIGQFLVNSNGSRKHLMKETGSLILRSSQRHHKSPSKQEKLTVNNIDIVPAKFVSDLVNHKLLCNIPLMSNLDPVYQLVLSQGHLEPLVTLKGYHQIHFGIDNTYYNVVRGTFPIYSANLKNNIINYISNCVQCRKNVLTSYSIPVTLVAPKISGIKPFQYVSMDDLGSITTRHPTNPRSTLEITPYIFSCITTGFIFTSLQPDKSTLSAINGLTEFCSVYNIPEKLITDAGLGLLQHNLQVKLRDNTNMFGNMEVINLPPKSQHRNIVESSVKRFKTLIKKTFHLKRNKTLPILHQNELNILFKVISNRLNNLPIGNPKSEITPRKLIGLAEPIPILGSCSDDSIKNIHRSLNKLRDYNELINTLANEWKFVPITPLLQHVGKPQLHNKGFAKVGDIAYLFNPSLGQEYLIVRIEEILSNTTALIATKRGLQVSPIKNLHPLVQETLSDLPDICSTEALENSGTNMGTSL